MSLANVEQEIRSVVDTLESFGDWLALHEAGTRCALVDPILWALGWSTWRPLECMPGLMLTGLTRVDYALLDRNGHIAALVDVNSQPLRERPDRMLVERNFENMASGIAVLTCGWEWEIYNLGIRTKRFDEKRLERLVLGPAQSDDLVNIAEALHRWLRKDLWW